MPKLIDHRKRREELALAAWQIILRDGVAQVSVRAVAAEVGLSAGSVRHVFPTQEELLVFLMDFVSERVNRRISALPPRATIRATVEEMAAQLLPLDEERNAEMQVAIALFTAANTEGRLKQPRDDAHRAQRALCRWMVEQLDNGVDLAAGSDVEVEAWRLHALLDGLSVDLVYEPDEPDPSWAVRVLSRHLDSLRA